MKDYKLAGIPQAELVGNASGHCVSGFVFFELAAYIIVYLRKFRVDCILATLRLQNHHWLSLTIIFMGTLPTQMMSLFLGARS